MPSVGELREPLSVRSRPNSLAWRAGAAFCSESSRSRTAPMVFGIGSVSWSLNGRGYNVSRHCRSVLSPTTVSISQAAARILVGQSHERGVERASPCAVDLRGLRATWAWEPHFLRKSRLLIPA